MPVRPQGQELSFDAPEAPAIDSTPGDRLSCAAWAAKDLTGNRITRPPVALDDLHDVFATLVFVPECPSHRRHLVLPSLWHSPSPRVADWPTLTPCWRYGQGRNDENRFVVQDGTTLAAGPQTGTIQGLRMIGGHAGGRTPVDGPWTMRASPSVTCSRGVGLASAAGAPCSPNARCTGFEVLKQIPSNVTLNCTSGAYPVSGSLCATRLEGRWLRCRSRDGYTRQSPSRASSVCSPSPRPASAAILVELGAPPGPCGRRPTCRYTYGQTRKAMQASGSHSKAIAVGHQSRRRNVKDAR